MPALLPPSWTAIIPTWLAEDTPSFDYGGFVVGDRPAEARLLAKSPGLLAGRPFFDAIFAYLGCSVEWHVAEGEHVGATQRQHVATVKGPVRNLLLGERVGLNVLARCSGVASQSAKLLKLVRGAGYKGILAGTRKTTPGCRLVEKYGMLVAGVDAHRIDLSTMTMLKDNHVWACGGSIAAAVAAAKSAGGFSIKVEVECRSYEEAVQAVDAGADVVMLDNFEPAERKAAAARLKEKYGRGPRAPLIEGSGGLTEENVGNYVCGDIDIISSSSIHQGVKHVDFSLKVVPMEAVGSKAGAAFGETTAQ